MINEVTLIGRIGADAEHQTTQGGKSLTKFSVATSESRQVDGAWETATEWHKVSLWGSEWLHPKLKKGVKVYVKGKLKSHEYNEKRYWEISAMQVKVLERDDTPRQQQTTGWG